MSSKTTKPPRPRSGRFSTPFNITDYHFRNRFPGFIQYRPYPSKLRMASAIPEANGMLFVPKLKAPIVTARNGSDSADSSGAEEVSASAITFSSEVYSALSAETDNSCSAEETAPSLSGNATETSDNMLFPEGIAAKICPIGSPPASARAGPPVCGALASFVVGWLVPGRIIIIIIPPPPPPHLFTSYAPYRQKSNH